MKVKMFDCTHELDLEDEINDFFAENPYIDVIQIEYQTHSFLEVNQTMFSFSAMIVYLEKNSEY